MARGDTRFPCSYHPNMPRKVPPARVPGPDWFLQEWMSTLGISQADLSRLTGWGKATTHDIYHGRTSFYRDIINTVARALNLEPFELLIPPERAMAFRQVDSAIRLAAETRTSYRSEPPEEALAA
jgi:hypothetical protein